MIPESHGFSRGRFNIASIYSLILALLLALVFVFLLFSKKIEENKLVSKEKSFVEKISQEQKACLPQKVFVDRVVYQGKIVYRDKVVYIRDPKKIRYGLSLIKTTSSKDSEESYLGLGLKLRYDQYYSLVEILENRSLLLSLGYEF